MAPMGSSLGALGVQTVLACALAGVACSHITKVPVTEIPIASFQSPEPAATALAPAPDKPPIIDETLAPATTTSAAAATAAAPTGAGAKPQAAPQPVQPPPADSGGGPEDRVQTASKLVKTGKHGDLVKARALLGSSVFAGSGTADEARMLRLVCTKLGDKACVQKSLPYIK
jgi:hypothetical protein